MQNAMAGCDVFCSVQANTDTWVMVHSTVLRILYCFVRKSQMTLALTAIYSFVTASTTSGQSIPAIFTFTLDSFVWSVSLRGGLALICLQCGFQQQTSGLLRCAFAIKEHTSFSQEVDMLVFGPPSVIATFCILAICCCYGFMDHAALRVSVALKCNNHRANRTVGFHLLMFLLQLNISSVIVKVEREREKAPWWCYC